MPAATAHSSLRSCCNCCAASAARLGKAVGGGKLMDCVKGGKKILTQAGTSFGHRKLVAARSIHVCVAAGSMRMAAVAGAGGACGAAAGL